MSGDVLDKLAARHARYQRKPPCPRCQARPTTARIMVQVKRTTKKEGTRGEEIVVSVVRTLCAECAAELFDQFAGELPEPTMPGGRPR